MSTSLSSIARDLAEMYPEASSRQIAQALADSIESRSLLMSVIGQIRTPTNLEFRIAEYKSERLKDQRARIRVRLDNAHFFERIKSLYAWPLESPSAPSRVELDGPDVDQPAGSRYSNQATASFTGFRAGADTISLSQAIYRNLNDPDHPFRNLAEGWAIETNRSGSTNALIEDLTHRLSSGQSLSFHHMDSMINLFKLSEPRKDTVARLLELLDKDIRLRNSADHTDCIEELYALNPSLPATDRVSLPSPSSSRDLFNEKLRAVALNQYKALHSAASADFINNAISYDFYLQLTARYACDVDRLFSSLP